MRFNALVSGTQNHFGMLTGVQMGEARQCHAY
jgi:hypothetical protein